jgi:hypothetical protein
MRSSSRELAVGGHDGCFLIVDRVAMDFVVGVRSRTGEVLSVYLMDADVEKLVRFLRQKDD